MPAKMRGSVDRWHPGSSVDDIFSPDQRVVKLNHTADSYFVGHVNPDGVPDGMGIVFQRPAHEFESHEGDTSAGSGREMYFAPFVGMFRAGCRCGWGVGTCCPPSGAPLFP
jgi:hypothetical protein